MSLDALARCCPIGAEFRSINAHEAEVDLVAVRSSKDPSGSYCSKARAFGLTV
jgi:hypothetical protein